MLQLAEAAHFRKVPRHIPGHLNADAGQHLMRRRCRLILSNHLLEQIGGAVALSACSERVGLVGNDGGGGRLQALGNIELGKRFGDAALVGQHGPVPVMGKRGLRRQSDCLLELRFSSGGVPLPEEINEAEDGVRIAEFWVELHGTAGGDFGFSVGFGAGQR